MVADETTGLPKAVLRNWSCLCGPLKFFLSTLLNATFEVWWVGVQNKVSHTELLNKRRNSTKKRCHFYWVVMAWKGKQRNKSTNKWRCEKRGMVILELVAAGNLYLWKNFGDIWDFTLSRVISRGRSECVKSS